MKILADLHHHDLFYSLQLLFEKRLHCELYRPIGLDWYHQGFWNVFPHIDTAKQFLGLDQAINPPKDIYGNYLSDREQLNKYYRFEDGIYYIKDTTKDKIQRGITLEKFKNMNFDIILSSIPQHIQPFNRLIALYQPKAKHVFQVGNAWNYMPGVKNILASTSRFSVSPDIHICFYHQEFDLEVFKYTDPVNSCRIDSYIHYMKQPEKLKTIAQLLQWEYHTHGAGMEDCFHKTSDIANCMKLSGWTWHFKPEGDGYGHILHNTFAVGRPVIIDKKHYAGKIADSLLIDQYTCLDIGGKSNNEIVQNLQTLSEPARHCELCQSAYKRFQQIVDFDKEEEQIRKFLENLL